MKRNKQWYINRWGKQDNVWYIDVKGIDQNGRIVWLSGNVLDQDEAGFGGFRDYLATKIIIDNFNTLSKITPDLYRHCSEDGVKSFKPTHIYLGYAPLTSENYQFWLERELD